MTLKELINSFKEKNKDVLINIQEIQGIPQPRISGFIKKGYAIVYKTSNGGINVRSVFVFVKSLGEESEEAYWENGEPILYQPSQSSVEAFRDKVEKFIKNAISEGTIHIGVIETVDENLKSAIVKVVVKDENTGNYVEKKLAVRYNSELEKIEYVGIS